MSQELFSIVLESAFDLSPNVKHFVFHCEKADFTFISGQFITIHFECNGYDKTLRRSYSIACSPQSHRIEFAAGYVKNGAASEMLFGLKPGDRLSISGPAGRLILKEETPKRYLFLSTSTGVTPFRSMLPELAQRFEKYPELSVVLLEGVQYQQDVLYADDFLKFASVHHRFQFHPCYSREKTADSLKAHERIGYVQGQLDALNVNPENDVVYLCGNPGMIDETFAALKEKGFDATNILREKYISSK